MTKKQLNFQGILFTCAAVLLMLVLLSTAMVTGRYARYITTSESSDSARVAKFAVEGVGGTDLSMTCTQTEAGQYRFSVNNNSEVAVRYTVSVEIENLAKITVKLDDADGTESDSTVTFAETVDLAPATQGKEHSLSFSVDDWSFVTNTNDGDKAEMTLPFTIHIHATQID